MDANYSVLMSVYYKENPEHLRRAIESMMNQTVPTDDFVLVCDGPLTPELDVVISEFVEKTPDIFHVIHLPQNQGLGNALNIGLQNCRNELVARMDSDDISLPNRCEVQLNMFKKNPLLALASGTIAEFDDIPEQFVSVRKLPLKDQDIRKFAKHRNPMNHMAVMFRKLAVIDAGNYRDMPLAEDYYLWVRMLCKGYQAQNTDNLLVYARIGNGMYSRRGGLTYAKKIYNLQKKLLEVGFISLWDFVQNCTVRIGASIMPTYVRKLIYQKKLRI